MCDVVPISTVQQSDSLYVYIRLCTHTHMYTFFFPLPTMIYSRDWVEFPVLYNRTPFLSLSLFFLFFFFCLFGATLPAYGSSQARGRIEATAAGLPYSRSHMGSQLPP